MRTNTHTAAAFAIAIALCTSSCKKDDDNNTPNANVPQGWNIYGVTNIGSTPFAVQRKHGSLWESPICVDGDTTSLWAHSGDSVAIIAMPTAVHFEGDSLIVDAVVDLRLHHYPGVDGDTQDGSDPLQSPCDPVGTHLAAPPTTVASVFYPIGHVFTEATWANGALVTAIKVP